MFRNILRTTLESFNGKYAIVNVKSAISIPYIIPKFQFLSDENRFMFDDEDNEVFQFDIWFDTVKSIEYDEDLEMLSFEIEEEDGFRTILEIMAR